MNKVYRSTTAVFVFVLSCVSMGVPLSAQAQFVPLAPFTPFLPEADLDIVNLLQALFAVSIGVAAVLAVVMVAIGGFNYMTTDSVFKMGNAREQISNALIGLLIVLIGVLMLRTINPQLVSLDVFRGVRGTPAPAYQTAGPGAATTPTYETPGAGAADCAAGCSWNGSACACATDDLGPPPTPPNLDAF